MAITDADLKQIALRLGTLEMELVVLRRENLELVANLVAAEKRLEDVGNSSGLVTEETN